MIIEFGLYIIDFLNVSESPLKNSQFLLIYHKSLFVFFWFNVHLPQRNLGGYCELNVSVPPQILLFYLIQLIN